MEVSKYRKAVPKSPTEVREAPMTVPKCPQPSFERAFSSELSGVVTSRTTYPLLPDSYGIQSSSSGALSASSLSTATSTSTAPSTPTPLPLLQRSSAASPSVLDSHPRVSVVVGCKDRTQYLTVALPSWLQHPQIGQVIIVDWYCSQPLADLCTHSDPRVSILHVQVPATTSTTTSPTTPTTTAPSLKTTAASLAPTDWMLTVALNFGCSHAQFPWILKVDADTLLSPTFFQRHPLGDTDLFYAGNWRTARNSNETHLNGVMLVARSWFTRVGGYNEYIRTYGYDDTDIYVRLQRAGARYHQLDYDGLEHISHSDALRTGTGFKDLPVEITTNMYIAQDYPWSAEHCTPTGFHCSAGATTCNANKHPVWHVDEESFARHRLTADQRDACRAKAYKVCLHPRLSWQEMSGLTGRELAARYAQLGTNGHVPRKPRFYIEPLNGLGNRLRAIASAGVLAHRSGRTLHIVWIANTHCEATFPELFATHGVEYDISDHRPVRSPSTPVHRLRHKDLLADGWIHSGFDIYMETACVIVHPLTSWKEEAHWLRQHIRPAAPLQKRIQTWWQEEQERTTGATTSSSSSTPVPASSSFVGVHIRMGQSVVTSSWERSDTWEECARRSVATARRTSHYSSFFAEMQRLAAQDPNARFLVCADRPEVYTMVEKMAAADPASPFRCRRPSCFDRSAAQIQEAVVDAWTLARCGRLLGSPWSSFTELMARLSDHGRVRLAGQDFPAGRRRKLWLGLLAYSSSLNLGDNIQTAAARFLATFVLGALSSSSSSSTASHTTPRPAARVEEEPVWVDRDHQYRFLSSGGGQANDRTESGARDPVPHVHDRVLVIENGWFDGRLTEPRWAHQLRPLYISFHLNEDPNLFRDGRFASMEREARTNASTTRRLLATAGAVDHFKHHEPIGCRDQHTLDQFRAAGIQAYVSSCLTLTMRFTVPEVPSAKRSATFYIVDAHMDELSLVRKWVPVPILQGAVRLEHGLRTALPHAEKERRAAELLERYRHARFVITNRLHCALPCLAFRTPVLFLHSSMEADRRFDSVLHSLLGDGQSVPAGWEWDHPVVPPDVDQRVQELGSAMLERARVFFSNELHLHASADDDNVSPYDEDKEVGLNGAAPLFRKVATQEIFHVHPTV